MSWDVLYWVLLATPWNSNCTCHMCYPEIFNSESMSGHLSPLWGSFQGSFWGRFEGRSRPLHLCPLYIFFIFIFICLFIYVFIYLYMYLFICFLIYIYIYTYIYILCSFVRLGHAWWTVHQIHVVPNLSLMPFGSRVIQNSYPYILEFLWVNRVCPGTSHVLCWGVVCGARHWGGGWPSVLLHNLWGS